MGANYKTCVAMDGAGALIHSAAREVLLALLPRIFASKCRRHLIALLDTQTELTIPPDSESARAMIKSDLTPPALRCGMGQCPAVLQLQDGRLVIIGTDPDADLSSELAQRVGPKEHAIIVSPQLLANCKPRRMRRMLELKAPAVWGAAISSLFHKSWLLALITIAWKPPSFWCRVAI